MVLENLAKYWARYMPHGAILCMADSGKRRHGGRREDHLVQLV